METSKKTILLALERVGSEIYDLILNQASELGWQLFDNSRRGGGWPLKVAPDGVILDLPDSYTVREVMRRRCPAVRLGRAPHPNDLNVPAVVNDLRACGRVAAEHFGEQGFKNVGFVGYDVDPASETNLHGLIYSGFVERSSELGCNCQLLSFDSSKAVQAKNYLEKYWLRQREFLEWASVLPKPMALFTFSTHAAATLCCMCADSGIEVPREFAIVGLGGTNADALCSIPQISCVKLDYEAQVAQVIKALARLIEGKKVSDSTVKVPPLGIVKRESSDTVGAQDPKVVDAVLYLWDNLAENIAVDDVARKVGLPRRTLERKFKNELGRSLIEELQRKRLDVLCSLLRTTDCKVIDLAAKVGFPSPEHLHRVFRREIRMTPLQYRQRMLCSGLDG